MGGKIKTVDDEEFGGMDAGKFERHVGD